LNEIVHIADILSSIVGETGTELAIDRPIDGIDQMPPF
jgi:hypothetical protein